MVGFNLNFKYLSSLNAQLTVEQIRLRKPTTAYMLALAASLLKKHETTIATSNIR